MQLVLLELNEINFEIVKKYINNGKLKNFNQIFAEGYKRTTSEKEYHKLEPWNQLNRMKITRISTRTTCTLLWEK